MDREVDALRLGALGTLAARLRAARFFFLLTERERDLLTLMLLLLPFGTRAARRFPRLLLRLAERFAPLGALARRRDLDRLLELLFLDLRGFLDMERDTDTEVSESVMVMILRVTNICENVRC